MKKLSPQQRKKLLEELRAIQKPSRKFTNEDYRKLAEADRKSERFQIRVAIEELRGNLLAMARRPGSLCKFLPHQLIPLHISTGIEKQPKEHFALLVERYQGQKRWLWGTSNKEKVQKNLRRLARVDDAKHLVTIPKKCIDSTKFSTIKHGINHINSEEGYDALVDSARHRVPQKSTFVAAHWKFFYVPPGLDPESPERFWGNVPNEILTKTVNLVSQ